MKLQQLLIKLWPGQGRTDGRTDAHTDTKKIVATMSRETASGLDKNRMTSDRFS